MQVHCRRLTIVTLRPILVPIYPTGQSYRRIYRNERLAAMSEKTHALFSAQHSESLPDWLSANATPIPVRVHGDKLRAMQLAAGLPVTANVQSGSDETYETTFTVCNLSGAATVAIELNGVEIDRQNVARTPRHSRLRIAIPSDGRRHTVAIHPIDGTMAFWRVCAGSLGDDRGIIQVPEVKSLFADHGVMPVPLLPGVIERRPRLFLGPRFLDRIRAERETYRSRGWWRPMLPMGGEENLASDNVVRN